MKKIDDEQLRDLNYQAECAFQTMMNTWSLGMKSYPIRSREYQAICRAGKAVRDLQRILAVQADDRGDRTFLGGKNSCTFN